MNNTRAIFLMIGAMAGFASVDAFFKLATATQSPGQILALTSIGSLAIFTVILWRNGERLVHADALVPLVQIRAAAETAGTFGIVMALAVVPLAEVTVIAQSQPLVVTLMAAAFLGEKVGPRRWTAVALGLLGVIIIMRPGLGTFDPNHLWVLLYVVGLSFRDVASRALPSNLSTAFVVSWSLIWMICFGAFLMPFQGGWHPIDRQTAFYLAGITITVSIALALITMSFRAGEIGAVAPFRYARIVFGLALAWLVFGETLDLISWLGLALIVGSGLYAFWRENQLSRG
ncbi:MAG: DMT family transporter [Silicimonas sp.]|nr:DMT family transporter [Silicimonas sp.]